MNQLTGSIAKIFSYVFHPLIMPSIGVFFIFSSGTYLSFMPSEGIRIIFLITFLGTFIIPLCFIPVYYYFNIVKNIEMDTPSQRVIPLLMTFFTYCCTFYLMRRIPIPFVNNFILACCVVLLLNLLIFLKWKISSHLLGLGGLTGLLISMNVRLNADINYFLIITLLVTGFVAASRLKLNAHTPTQVYSAYLTGVFVVSFFLLFI